jgi:uncharacterized membrane protein
MRSVLRVLSAAFVVTYPLAVYLGLPHLGAKALSLLLAGLLLLGLPFRLSGAARGHVAAILRIPLTVLAVLLLGALFDDRRFVLALPVITNVLLLAQFASSLRGTPIVERFARAQESELSDAEIAYCRAVTVTWCVFFVVNGAITAGLATLAPLGWWTLYTGVVSYVLLGALATIEYVIRKHRFRKFGAHLVDRALAKVFVQLDRASVRVTS